MSVSDFFSRKLRGEARFTTDIMPLNTLHGITIRAQIPRGDIMGIELPPLPENCFALTAEDIPGINAMNLFGESMPLLADKEVSYYGEPVILLAGPNKKQLREIASLVEIYYQEKESVLSLDSLTYNRLEDHIKIPLGNTDRAFASAEHIVRGEYKTGTQLPFNIEPVCAVAMHDEYQTLVYAASNYPYNVKENVASFLGISRKKVRVIVPDVSAPLGGNLIMPLVISCHAALLSYISKRPVKIQYSQIENYYFTAQRYPFWIQYESAIDKNGAILGRRVNLYIDNGRYKFYSRNIINKVINTAMETYRCQSLEMNIVLNCTNKFPIGGFNGIGETELCFAQELHSNQIAEKVNQDPFVWKTRNLAGIGPHLVKQQKASELNSPFLVMEKVIAISDFSRKYGAYLALSRKDEDPLQSPGPIRGVGLALCAHNLMAGQEATKSDYSMRVTLTKNKKLHIFTSAVDSTNSKAAMFTAIVLEILEDFNIRPGDIILEQVDTEKVPDSGATFGSKGVIILGELLKQCCQGIKRKLQKGTPLPVEIKKKHTVMEDTFSEKSKHSTFLGTTWEGTVVEVEINPVTFEITCRGIWVVLDAGRILAPEVARATIEASAIQNYAFITSELINYKDKFALPFSTLEFTIPGALDVPPIQVEFIDHQGKAPPKGLGEQSVCGLAPAFAAAVSQALRTNFNKTPITPEVIRKLLEVQ